MPNATWLYDDPVLRPIHHFDGARDHAAPGERLACVRAQARRFRDEMLAGQPVVYYRSFDLIRVPYPTRYALRDACTVPTPYIHILNRLFIVQFQSIDGIKTLLISPSDVGANRETPFFKRLAERFTRFGVSVESLLAPELSTVEDCLARVGLRPEDVDYITYDHLHTQDLRRWLGTEERPAYFPNARLLVMRQEWVSARALLPPQADWYCPDGTVGIPPEKIILLDHDVMLGEGVALIRTPGHTEGNHSIVVHTPEGLLVTSENGVGADAYAPRHSRIPGLQKYVRETGMEVVLNGNTLERGLDQYISMIQEREIAGPAPRNPDFYNVVPSSELTAYWLFPGIVPTFTFGALEFGQLHRRAA
ncbi:MAG: hypothetical protein D6723_12980 [Acidobacteria bacterium]|nr:MAG: hypothetical protein D6723_12980 [Acidobacteriota bacterium]